MDHTKILNESINSFEIDNLISDISILILDKNCSIAYKHGEFEMTEELKIRKISSECFNKKCKYFKENFTYDIYNCGHSELKWIILRYKNGGIEYELISEIYSKYLKELIKKINFYARIDNVFIKENLTDISDLSCRELEVLELVSKNLTDMEISKRLYISKSTIRAHINSIFRKTGMNRKYDLLKYYYYHSFMKMSKVEE